MNRRIWIALALLVSTAFTWGLAARAEAPLVRLDGRGTTIPLLHEYETEYASLREEIEAACAPVGISSEKKKGCVFTVDQVAASDGYLLAFFTVTSDEPFVRPQDRSIYGWYAKSGTVVFLHATLDGDEDVNNELSGLHDHEIFFKDEHTIVGWSLFRGIFRPVRIPEVCEVKLTASPGTGVIDLDLDVTFTLDRSTKLPGFREADLDVPMVCSLPGDRGAERNIRFTHVSMSPLGNLLTVEEEVIAQETWLTVLAEQGNQLVQVLGQGTMYGGASPQHPIHVETYFAFVGGRDGHKLTVAPVQLIEEGNRVRIPTGGPLPCTYTFDNGGQFTILELTIDRNRLLVKYKSECIGRLDFSYFYDKNGKQIKKFTGLNGDTSLDRGSGVYTTEKRWPPEKDAEKGERISQETLDRLKYVEVSGIHREPMPEYAVEIALPD